MKNRGFTLLELLLVVTLVAILAGTITFALAGRDQDRLLQTEAQRLVLLVELARDEAQLRNEEMGLRIHEDSYQFLRYDDAAGSWQELASSPFHPRQLDRIHLSVEVEQPPGLGDSQDTRTTQSAQSNQPANRDLPQIMLFSSGELTPFVIAVQPPEHTGAGGWQVSSDGLSRARMEQIL